MIYTIFDIETDGLIVGNKFPHVLEVGYIQINNDVEILRGGSFYFYRPEWDLKADALKVNGLTKEFLAEHENDYFSSMVKLWTLMQKGYLIGKNSDAFDIPVCRSMFSACSVMPVLPSVAASYDLQKIWAPVYRDVMQQLSGTRPKGPGKLGEYVKLLGYSDEDVQKQFEELFPDEKRCGAHGALYDSYMTYLVLKDAINRRLVALGG